MDHFPYVCVLRILLVSLGNLVESHDAHVFVKLLHFLTSEVRKNGYHG